MKTILLWDMRFPDRQPRRLTLADSIASACYRTGIAAPVNPADIAALAVGGPLSGATPTEIILQHGLLNQITRVVVPLAVAALALAAGLGEPIGSIIISLIPPGALAFADNTPLQLSDGSYLELAS